MSLSPDDLDAVCGLVSDLCGIYLDGSKEYLIEGRLADLLKRHSCASYAELARKARFGAAPTLKDEVINAITTNETLWFRDNTPFEALKNKMFPEIIDARAGSVFPRKIRIWSAASSTGQEAYSIAMAFADIVPEIAEWDLQIVGTDISPAAVERAKRGEYTPLEVSRGLNQQHLSGYFTKCGENWKVCDEIRAKCRFETGNLLKPLASIGKFDIIFCRNVAIYFTPPDRVKMFNAIADLLNPGGWLFVGSGESLMSLGPEWSPKQHCRAICYQPKGGLTYAH
jgi:chemotaxis protein methyltransferase CheR